MSSEHPHSHGTLRRVRKRRKHSRKLRDNRELMASVVVLVVFGLLLVGLATYLLSTQACHAPKLLR